MRFDEKKIYSTLRERSEDDNGQSFIDSTQIVYDFDEITKEVADTYRNKKPAASCDALYVKDESHIYLIEFKNARKSRIGNKFFLQKAYDSALTLGFAFYQNLSFEELRERLYLVIVYNDDNVEEKEQESEHFDSLKEKIGCLAGPKRRILFGLDMYEGSLYKKVVTVEKNIFMEQVYKDIFNG